MYRPNEGVTEKCIGCFPRIEDGIGSRCVVACVGKIRLQGWVSPPEKADPSNPLDYLVHVAKVALPLYPQFGTEPNLYYIPPRWAPRPFLKQLFGPGVEDAIETYTNPDDKLFGLLRLFGVTQQIITRFEVNDEEAIGWNEAGEEIARMPFDEPIFVRDEIDVRFDVQRLNEP
jgi:nitrate reductase beta subunit